MEICKLEGFIIKIKNEKGDRFVCWSNSFNNTRYLTKEEIKNEMATFGWQPKIYVTHGKAKIAATHLPNHYEVDVKNYEICPVYVTISDRD